MSRMSFCVLLATLVMSLLVVEPSSAKGGVALRDGAYFVAFDDITLEGGADVGLSRLYDSAVAKQGWFGVGWSTKYETTLVVGEKDLQLNDGYGDGNRCGCGLRRYVSEDTNASPTNSPIGTRFRNPRFSTEEVIRLRNGFVRRLSSGMMQNFDNQGRLISITQRGRSHTAIEHAADGTKITISDGPTRQIVLRVQDGLVVEATGPGKRSVSYRYDTSLLVSSTSSDGETHYMYNPDNKVDGIMYPDKTRVAIKYSDGRVSRVEDQDHTFTEYGYVTSNHGYTRTQTVSVIVRSADSSEISSSTYVYHVYDDEWRGTSESRLVVDRDGTKTDTNYDLRGLPLEILRDGIATRFRYDARGQVLEKTTSTEVTIMTYHPLVDKVTSVRTYPRSRPEKAKRHIFTYDYLGNLVRAEDADGKTVFITYDRKSRISQLVTRSGEKIAFQYNEVSKPVTIEADGLGVIKIKYKPNGDIEKVSSEGGRAIALRVTSAFQELLDIIRPAGVSLSF